LKNSAGGHLRGRPILAGRALAEADVAAAVFFRAGDRDRGRYPARAASLLHHAENRKFSTKTRSLR